LWIAAKFSPSCQSPSLVAPSPNQQPTAACSSRYRIAYAIPVACGTWVAIGDEWLTMPRRRALQWLGICRPPEDGSSAFENTPRNTS